MKANNSKLVKLMKTTDRLETEYRQAKRDLGEAIIAMRNTTLHTAEHEKAQHSYHVAWKRKNKACAKLNKAYDELNEFVMANTN
jgi:hypothetical protein